MAQCLLFEKIAEWKFEENEDIANEENCGKIVMIANGSFQFGGE